MARRATVGAARREDTPRGNFPIVGACIGGAFGVKWRAQATVREGKERANDHAFATARKYGTHKFNCGGPLGTTESRRGRGCLPLPKCRKEQASWQRR